MKTMVVLLLSVCLNAAALADSSATLPCDTMSFDGFSYNYTFISSADIKSKGSSERTETGSPRLAFCLPIYSVILRPTLGFNTSQQTPSGSLAAGIHVGNRSELGLFTSVRQNKNTLGSGIEKYEVLNYDLAAGPYILLYPILTSAHFLELSLHANYLYSTNRITLSGAQAVTSKIQGGSADLGFLFGFHTSKNMSYTPNIHVSYAYKYETVGRITSNTMGIQAVPVSFQYEFN